MFNLKTYKSLTKQDLKAIADFLLINHSDKLTPDQNFFLFLIIDDILKIPTRTPETLEVGDLITTTNTNLYRTVTKINNNVIYIDTIPYDRDTFVIRLGAQIIPHQALTLLKELIQCLTR